METMGNLFDAEFLKGYLETNCNDYLKKNDLYFAVRKSNRENSKSLYVYSYFKHNNTFYKGSSFRISDHKCNHGHCPTFVVFDEDENIENHKREIIGSFINSCKNTLRKRKNFIFKVISLQLRGGNNGK